MSIPEPVRDLESLADAESEWDSPFGQVPTATELDANGALDGLVARIDASQLQLSVSGDVKL